MMIEHTKIFLDNNSKPHNDWMELLNELSLKCNVYLYLLCHLCNVLVHLIYLLLIYILLF